MPAQIDKVLAVTGKKTLQYIGWSEGTLALFALLSEQPEYNEKVSSDFSVEHLGILPKQISSGLRDLNLL